MVPEGREVEPYELEHFFQAASCGSIHILRMFLEQGRTLSERDQGSGWTALHFVCVLGLVSFVQYLLEQGADC